MKPKTKKFIKWLIISDILLIIIVLILGFLFIKTNVNRRFNLLGQAMGQFIFFSNLIAFGIFYFITKKKQN